MQARSSDDDGDRGTPKTLACWLARLQRSLYDAQGACLLASPLEWLSPREGVRGRGCDRRETAPCPSAVVVCYLRVCIAASSSSSGSRVVAEMEGRGRPVPRKNVRRVVTSTRDS